jgi:hypothetical protein
MELCSLVVDGAPRLWVLDYGWKRLRNYLLSGKLKREILGEPWI